MSSLAAITRRAPGESSSISGDAAGSAYSSSHRAPEKTLPSGHRLYGFVVWISIHVAYTLFILWAHLPAHVLRSLGVTYYPDHHWALALPCWCFVTAIAVVVFYASYNLVQLPDLASTSTIVDEYTRMPEERELATWGHDEHIHDAIDLPITFVSRVMLQAGEDHGANGSAFGRSRSAAARCRSIASTMPGSFPS